MKIAVNQIPSEGIVLTEQVAPEKLDLETGIIKFRAPLEIQAKVQRITNAVTVLLNFQASIATICGRCLKDIQVNINKDVQLHYSVDNSVLTIDLDPDIREEIILDYPINPLCKADCKGLCLKCGKNLNEGGCTCGTT